MMLGSFDIEKEDKCVWCCKTAAGLAVAFKDGLKGFLCWKHFREAVKARSNGKDAEAATEPVK